MERLRPVRPGDVPVLEHGVVPVMGSPVWCADCRYQIGEALWRLPEVAADLWDIGHGDDEPVLRSVSSPRGLQWVYAAPAADEGPGDPVEVLVVERLAGCGHIVTSKAARAPEGFAVRFCWQCTAEQPGSSGRLAPSAPAGRRPRGMAGSPSGSPSWDAIEQLISWTGRTEDYLRARVGAGGTTRQWWRGSEQQRAEAMTSSVRWLYEHLDELLAAKHAPAIGRELLRLSRRAQRAAGRDSWLHLKRVACPRCDRRSMYRQDGATYARCKSCGLVRALDDIDYLMAVTGAAAT